jgi:hypothetical protein
MPAGYQELFMEQGATFSIKITLDAVTTLPYDLTGYSANSQMKTSYYSSNAVATFVTSISKTPTDGNITLDLTHQETSNISPGRYVYDLYLCDNINDNRSRVLEGIVNVSPGVTLDAC